MRLLTWNIHKGIGGVDRRYALGRITAVVQHYDPDILLLQEVDDSVPRSRGDNQAELLAEVLAYPYHAYGANVRLKRGRYGNATLSRYPIAQSKNIDLTFSVKKARGGLYTELQTHVDRHRLTLHVVNVHLGLSGMERRWQIKRLLESPVLDHLDRHSRIVVAGDTNDWTQALGRGRLGREGFLCVTGSGQRATRTFPAWAPIGGLDRVFMRGPIAGRHHFGSRLSLARQASDHLPLIVDFDPLPR
jgi:endonuclease/exonuclease/phosphatase family metal-dependent hydrolase